MNTYFTSLSKKSSDQISDMVRKKDPNFPRNSTLFVRRDMFGDSCFPQVIIPATQEAFLAFFIGHHHRIHGDNQPEYRLEVAEYHGDAIVVVYYEGAEKSHWVNGFLRYNVPEDMQLPFSMQVTQESLKLCEGWSIKTLRPRNEEERTEGDILLWAKDE